jgi:cytochrome c553
LLLLPRIGLTRLLLELWALTSLVTLEKIGPKAEGVRDIPRLGGLDYSYLKRRLEQWNQGYHAAAGPPMISIASKLSDDQIEALASYLSYVK